MYEIEKIIEYLKGKIDIYTKEYFSIVLFWDKIWDEMKWMGYDPESVRDLRKYAEELAEGATMN